MKTGNQSEPGSGGAGGAKLAIVGTVEIAPGRKNQFLPLLMAHKARCLKDEPGTLQFEILTPHEDETKVHLYEVYQNAAAFETHRNGPSMARFREESAGMIAKLDLTRCAVVS